MRLADLPAGTAVAVTALPHVTATIVRHGPMATVVKLAPTTVTIGERSFARSATVLWSANTDVMVRP